MTITRVNPDGWVYAGEVTSTQLNDVDANIENALDKRSGQTDTLASDVTVTGDATVASGGSIAFQSGSALTVSSGTAVSATVSSGGSVTVASGASLTTASGSTVSLTCNSASSIAFSPTISRTIFFSTCNPPLILSTPVLGYNGDNSYVSVIANSVGGVGTWRIPIIHGATLSSVDFLYQLAAGARNPTLKLKFNIWRINPMTFAEEKLFSSDQTANYGGTFGSQTFSTHAPDQNNVIDGTAYNYEVAFSDEWGGGSSAGNCIMGWKFTYSNISGLYAIQ